MEKVLSKKKFLDGVINQGSGFIKDVFDKYDAKLPDWYVPKVMGLNEIFLEYQKEVGISINLATFNVITSRGYDLALKDKRKVSWAEFLDDFFRYGGELTEEYKPLKGVSKRTSWRGTKVIDDLEAERRKSYKSTYKNLYKTLINQLKKG